MGKTQDKFFFSTNLEYGILDQDKLNQLMLDLTLSTIKEFWKLDDKKTSHMV